MYLAREIKRNVDKETVSHAQLHTSNHQNAEL